MNRKVILALARLAESKATDEQIAVHFRVLTSDQLRKALKNVPVAVAECQTQDQQIVVERLALIMKNILAGRVCVAS